MKLNSSFCLDFKADDLLRYEHILVYILYIYLRKIYSLFSSLEL